MTTTKNVLKSTKLVDEHRIRKCPHYKKHLGCIDRDFGLMGCPNRDAYECQVGVIPLEEHKKIVEELLLKKNRQFEEDSLLSQDAAKYWLLQSLKTKIEKMKWTKANKDNPARYGYNMAIDDVLNLLRKEMKE